MRATMVRAMVKATVALFMLTGAFARAQGGGFAVLTHRYDTSRSGLNSQERALTPDTVAKGFGKLYEFPVDGLIYAQPLYVPGLKLADGTVHNVVFIASMGNQLYAYDADHAPAPDGAGWLWKADLRHAPGLKDVRILHDDPRPIAAFKGILSTPVIDLQNGVIFVDSMDVDEGHDAIYRLYKLDLASGKVLKFVDVSGSLPGTGDDAKIINGQSRVPFDPNHHLQRPALLIHRGYVHLGFGSIGDQQPFHGWIFSFRTSDLGGGPTFLSSPIAVTDEPGGGVWQSGAGFSIDPEGAVYIATGNGDFSPKDGDWGNSILKLDFNPAEPGFHVQDSFTPFNQKELDDLDLDVGSAGVVFIAPHYVIGAGKTGKFYILDSNHLGGYTPDGNGDLGAIEVLQVTDPSWKKIVNNTFMWNIHGAPVLWNDHLYVMGESDPVKSFSMNLQTGRVADEASSRSKFSAPIGMPGGFISVSANDAKPVDSGIVWVSHPFDGDATFEIRPGLLHALDARDLTHELWNSRTLAGDDYGSFAKFIPPVIADGKVFMATFSEKVVVYGLKD